jgi:hypothetical protein
VLGSGSQCSYQAKDARQIKQLLNGQFAGHRKSDTHALADLDLHAGMCCLSMLDTPTRFEKPKEGVRNE